MPDRRIQALWALDPEYGHAPWRASPDRTERVLHVHLATPDEPQSALCHALSSLAADGAYRRVDWTALGTPSARRDAVVGAAADLRPSLIFMQLQGPDVLDPAAVEAMRRAAGTPELVVVSWCGDVGRTHGPFPAPGDHWAFDLARHCDLMLYTSLSQVRAHRSRGMHNAAYLQIGFDEDRFYEGPEDDYGSRFSIVFVGQNYNPAHWTSVPGEESGLRRAVVGRLRQAHGVRFGLFGTGWGAGVTPVPSRESGDVYRRSRMALSLSLCSGFERYSSDRLFRALACGSAVLLKTFDDWRSFGLADEHNVLVWDSADDAERIAAQWLAPERAPALREVGRRGAALAREHHTWGVRMRELWPMVAVMRGTPGSIERPW